MTAVLDPRTSHLSQDRPELADVSGIPFVRLIRVELRKMVDTRAGRWMLIVIQSLRSTCSSRPTCLRVASMPASAM